MIIKKVRLFFAVLAIFHFICESKAATTSFSLNFGKSRESSATTAPYSGAGLGGAAIPWTVNSSTSKTTTAQSATVTTLGAPVQLKYYFDGSGTGTNTMSTVGTTNANRGFLADGRYATGTASGWGVEITGLSDWLAANNADSWQLVVLQSNSSRDARFRDINIWESNTVTTSGPGGNNWLGDPAAVNGGIDRWPERLNSPTGVLSTNSATYQTAAGGALAETVVYSGTADAFIIRDTARGNTGTAAAPIRGSIAGFILQVNQNSILAVPEPSASLMGVTTVAAFLSIRHRRLTRLHFGAG